jgi:hypothetical protein
VGAKGCGGVTTDPTVATDAPTGKGETTVDVATGTVEVEKGNGFCLFIITLFLVGTITLWIFGTTTLCIFGTLTITFS